MSRKLFLKNINKRKSILSLDVDKILKNIIILIYNNYLLVIIFKKN